MSTSPSPAHDTRSQDRPGLLWRAAALAWLLAVLVVAVHQWHFWHGQRMDTDVLALLPVNEQAPEVTRATQQLADQLSRQVTVLLGTPDWAGSRQAAQQFRQSLSRQAAVPLREQALAQQVSMQAALDFYQPWRQSLLTPQQGDRLQHTPGEVLVQQVLQDL